MKELISHLLKQVAAILEYVIAFMLAIGIILLCLRMVCSLQYIPNLNTYPNYDDLLEVCFNLIIGVELIRMMYSHSPSTVFEVLLFAIARTHHYGPHFHLQQSDRRLFHRSLICNQKILILRIRHSRRNGIPCFNQG